MLLITKGFPNFGGPFLAFDLLELLLIDLFGIMLGLGFVFFTWQTTYWIEYRIAKVIFIN